MTFANQKEETLNLELTSYGRYLLSLGKFKPHQYAFFDDDIVYDRNFVMAASGTVELQNNIEGRIQEETPRLRPQSIYRPAQIGVFSENPNHVNNLMPGAVEASNKKASEFLLETPENSYIYSDPIGSSAYNSKNAAAWNVGFYKAGLRTVDYAWTGSVDAMNTGSTTIPTTFIPQLGCDIRYEAHFYPSDPDYANDDEIPMYIQDLSDVSPDGVKRISMEKEDNLQIPYKLNDDSYVTVFDDYTFLKVEESNTEFEKENFEIEVYMIKSEAIGKNPEVLERLYFVSGDDEITDKHVEYYFDIDFDFDIEEDEFCALSRYKEKITNIYADKIFNCDDSGKMLGAPKVNIYGTAENQDIGDVCD